MTQLQRQIRTTQHRLWINRWMSAAARSLTIVVAVFAAVVLVQRAFTISIPLMTTGLGLAGAGLIASIVWTHVHRENESHAAAALDQAAGLRERLSSARYCQDGDDPFAQAVVADAEHISGSLSARQHIRLTVPQSLGPAGFAVAIAALMFLVPLGWLTSSEAAEIDEQATAVREAHVAVKRQMDRVREIVDNTPSLDDIKSKLDGLEKPTSAQMNRPGDIRHAALKKIDNLSDAVKQKRDDARHDAVNEMRKMLRSLKTTETPNAPTEKLTKALRAGDFKKAKEEVNALREQLATLKFDKDKEMVKKITKQLEELAKQLESKSKSKEEMAKKLRDAGLTKEEVKRALEALKKKDFDQLKKELQAKGLNKKQSDKLTKELKKKQQAGGMASKLAKGMKQGAKGAAGGKSGDAMAGLSMAGEQLGELEKLEQEMKEMNSTLSDLQAARNDISKPCSKCNGAGCSKCKGGNKGGMGKKGQGRGNLASEQQTSVGFKTERGKVPTGRGAIIGQFLFEGEQVKGEVSHQFTEIVAAAEHDASDRVNRNRVPRQYHKAIRSYFSTVQKSLESAKVREPAPSATDGTKSDGQSGDKP